MILEKKPKKIRLEFLKNQFKNSIKFLIIHQNIQAALILTGFLLIFFSTPLLNHRTTYYSSADILVVPDNEAKNRILFDSALLMQPWLMFNRDSFFRGEIPLWNPYNGNGVPHLGNYQSSVFSFFSLPYYIFPFRKALIIAPFLKLFTLGFFTFLFLKQLKLKQGSALLGAVTFMFSGYSIVWLQSHNTESVVVLPATLFFAEKIFSCFEAEIIRTQETANSKFNVPVFLPLIGFSLSIAAGLLAGHPESFFMCALLVSAYILFRVLNLWQLANFDLKGLINLGLLTGKLLLVAILGVGLSAIQLLPFFEYLQNSSSISNRSNLWPTSLPAIQWPLSIFPNLLGNPGSSFKTDYTKLPLGDYNEATGSYVGALILFLAFLSLFYVRRNKYVAFFIGAAIVYLFYNFNVAFTQGILLLIPQLPSVLLFRSEPIWDFSLVCLAAIFINYLMSSHVIHKRLYALLIGILGIAFLIIGILGAQRAVNFFYPKLLPYAADFLAYMPSHVWWVGGSFGVGLLAIMAFGYNFKKTWQKSSLCCLLIFLVFFETGFLFKDFNPTIEDKYFYPNNNPVIKEILVSSYGEPLPNVNSYLFADTNMLYGFAQPTNYDALDVKNFKELYEAIFDGRLIQDQKPLESILKLFGINYFVTWGDAVKLGLAEVENSATKVYHVGELLPGKDIVQTFQVTDSKLYGLRLNLATLGRNNKCTVNIKLQEVSSAKVVREQTIVCQDIKDGTPNIISFDPLDSLNQSYRLTLSSNDSSPGNAVTAIAKSDLNYPQGNLAFGGKTQTGGLWFDYYPFRTDTFQIVTNDNGLYLNKYKASPSPYYTVSNALFFSTEAQVLDFIKQRNFDPAQEVMLVGNIGKVKQQSNPVIKAEQAPKVQLLSEKATDIKLQVTRTTPGYLVLAKTYYPGWKAKVNGQEQPVLKANYAFSAIELDAGESTVEYYYDPASFRYGLIISLSVLIIGVLAIVFHIRLRPKS